jgi:prepilin-type N-terminal cleavage/methylation domain-containing protein
VKSPYAEKQEKSVVSRWFFPKSVEMEPHGQGGGSIQPNLGGDISRLNPGQAGPRWRILLPAWYRGRSSATGMNRRGTTLAELLIVMAIIGIGATLTVPNMGKQIARYRLKTAAREISNFLLETRAEAVKNSDIDNPRYYRVFFSQAAGTYVRQRYESASWANDGVSKTLTTNVTIASLVPSTINDLYFTSEGSLLRDVDGNPANLIFDNAPVEGKIRLRNSRGDQYQVVLFSASGLTEIQEGWR